MFFTTDTLLAMNDDSNTPAYSSVNSPTPDELVEKPVIPQKNGTASSDPESLPQPKEDKPKPEQLSVEPKTKITKPPVTPEPVKTPNIPEAKPQPNIDPVDEKPTPKPINKVTSPAPKEPSAVEDKPKPATKKTPNDVKTPTAAATPKTLQPIDVTKLSDAELKAAATLYTKRNQKSISAKGVAKRKQIMQENIQEILAYLAIDSGAPLPRIAKIINVSPGTTSSYLRRLIADNKVQATGWGSTRRYFKK